MLADALAGLGPGARVQHEGYGPGEVTRLVRGGRAALVRFDGLGRLDIQVPVAQLEVTEPSTTPTASTTEPTTLEAPEALSTEQKVPFERLQLLEALRLGTVPARGLELYTVGRDKELANADADLSAAEAGGAARVILGDYGTGKTHLLECVATRALEAGWLVGLTALDPVDVPASNPRRVYRGLVKSLRYPEQTGVSGLLPLLEQASASRAVAERFMKSGQHPYLTPALKLYEALDAEEAAPLVNWLEGAPQDHTPALNRRWSLYKDRALPAMMDYRPWAHIYAHLVSGLAGVARAVGYKGLVLLLDEGELFRVLDAENRRFAERLFRALMAAALPASALPFDASAEPKGGRGTFKVLPYRYGDDCPLVVMLAMTPTGEGEALLEGLVGHERLTELSALNAEDYRVMAGRIVALYADRHPRLKPRVEALSGLVGDLIYNGLADGHFNTPRTAVKFVVDLLDMARVTPERVRPALTEIKALWP